VTWALSHLRAFVANQVLSRIRAFLGLFCPDFYSDIRDFTQILCRYLPKKLAAGTSVANSTGATNNGASSVIRKIINNKLQCVMG